MFELAFAWILLLLPLPLIIWYLQKGKQHLPATIKTPLFAYWQSLHTHAQSGKKNLWQKILLMLIWSLLIFAAARPQWVGEAIQLPSSGRDLLLSIDVSISMRETDLQLKGRSANRLQVVKAIASEFIDKRKGDRIGLVLFGKQAYLQTPLTLDLKTVKYMLNDAQIGLAGDSHTAIGDGIGLSVKQLRERPEQNRILILLTDGQNNIGELDPLEAAKLAKHAGVKIYTIGVGADEAYRRSMFGMIKVNPSEQLDEKTLTQVAEITGGRYFRARSTDELQSIYGLLDELEPVAGEQQTYRPVWELYFYPTLAAFLLLLLPGLFNFVYKQFKLKNKHFSDQQTSSKNSYREYSNAR